jgi:hypothetical protein
LGQGMYSIAPILGVIRKGTPAASLLGGVVLLVLSASAGNSGSALELSTISSEELARIDVRLKTPWDIKPRIGSSSAADAAREVIPGTSVLEVALAHVVTDDMERPGMNRVLWVVSLEPPARGTCFGCGLVMPPGSTPPPAGFALALIDPFSGVAVDYVIVGGTFSIPGITSETDLFSLD